MKKQTWICDSCGQPIQQEQDGYIEWLMSGEGISSTGRGLRLVHHQPASPHAPTGSCQYDANLEARRDGSILNDLSLERFLGADGLMLLLSMLAEERLPKQEVLELTKRLHIPGYEHARFHFTRAIAAGVFEPDTLTGYHLQSDIQAVLKFVVAESAGS